MRILVIGGTLFVGRLLVEELAAAGHEIAVLHRKPKHDLGRKIENLTADRNDSAAVREALAGRRFDAVFDDVYDWERGTTAAQVEATARACWHPRLSRYIFLSSVSAYGDGLNHYEGDALAPDNHPVASVRNKAMTERTLFRMHENSGFPVVTFRPPFIFGPENPFYRETFFWDRMRAGRAIIVPGDGHRLMQFVYVKDLVAAMVQALERPGAVGEAFNIGDPRPVTQAEFVAVLAKVAGKDANMVRVPRDTIQQAGGNTTGEPLYFGDLLDLPPITENVTKVTRVLGVKPTPLEAGLRETYKWYQRRKRFAPDFSFEDRLLAGAR